MGKEDRKNMKFKEKFKKIIGFLLNPHFLLCFGIAWLITYGWSYFMLGIGTYYEIGWMMAVAALILLFCGFRSRLRR